MPRETALIWLQQSLLIDTDSCIIWPFYKLPKGYGQINYCGVVVLVHRLVLHLTTGFNFLNPALDVMHSCDNPSCINKKHLSAGTRFSNMKDASEKGRLRRVPQKFCIRGHVFDNTNTYIAPDGRRRCKKCRYAAVERFRLNASINR